MIIKSHIRGGFSSAAEYLKQQGKNEQTRLVEMSQPHVRNLDEAFRAMWAISAGTKVKKPLHHVSINPMKDERLTDEQVRRICEALESRYGYAHGEHQRVVVEHIKDGRQHFHVMWNRVNAMTGKPHYPFLHQRQSIIVARQMETELGLMSPVPRHKAARRVRAGGRLRVPAAGRRLETHVNSARGIRHRRVYYDSASADGRNPRRRVRSNRLHPPRPECPLVLQAGLGHGSRPLWQELPAPSPAMSTGATSGMCEEQRLDFIAACEGKITWRQYFRKWGNPGRASALSPG